MRLIDADVLTERLNNAIECGRRVDMPTLELEAVLVNVQNAPSIDIVRCKECRWAKANGTYQWCGRLDSTARITADDFCSYGQKGDENVETD